MRTSPVPHGEALSSSAWTYAGSHHDPGRFVTESDARLAHRLATQVGRMLVAVRNDHLHVTGPVEGRRGDPALADRGDAIAQQFIAAELAVHRAGDQVLSEEAPDSLERLGADRVWIIDPLDGTRGYSAGRQQWAVHIALWSHGDLTAGAIALPDRGVTFATDDVRPPGPPPGGTPLRVVVSRSREADLVARVIDALGARPIHRGSAGYKVGSILLGEADAYLHAGGQSEWDSAAPVAVARAAGLHTSRLDGSELTYNQRDVFLPDLLVCRHRHAPTVLRAVASAQHEGES